MAWSCAFEGVGGVHVAWLGIINLVGTISWHLVNNFSCCLFWRNFGCVGNILGVGRWIGLIALALFVSSPSLHVGCSIIDHSFSFTSDNQMSVPQGQTISLEMQALKRRSM
ncbi:hypothetical protein B0T09DRAFT_7000 [Sordaria sp. MPI-SDFR-AT-0083]|nr:hypothetical protein B0T09DRAFT_7000 [Sordaria sp. MPI-SDFR-AT-0083]